MGQTKNQTSLSSGNQDARHPGRSALYSLPRSTVASQPLVWSLWRGPFDFSWQNERAWRLHKAFARVEARILQGEKLAHVLPRLARRWSRPRAYRSEPSRKLQYSHGSIVRLFYQWRTGGRTPGALVLRYNSACKILGPADGILLIGLVSRQGVRSVASVQHMVLPDLKVKRISQYINVLPHHTRCLLQDLFRVRTQERRILKKLAEVRKGLENRIGGAK